jgi:hypothetical protein
MGLGDNKTKFLFRCQGWVAPDMAHSLLRKLIETIGMTPARKHPVDHYPFNGGGGEGFTAYFPLMESYAVMDVYYDTNETEILISTCCPDRLKVAAVIAFLGKEIGPATGGKLKEDF